MFPEDPHHPGHRVGDVVVPRAAGEAHPSGHGQVPLLGHAEGPRGHPDRGREARVQVEVGHTVGVGVGERQCGATGGGHRGGLVERPAQRDVGLGRLGPAVGEHPAVTADPQRLGPFDRAAHQRGGLVQHLVAVHALGVGEPDHAVVGAGLGDLLGRVPGALPRVGVVGGDLAEAGVEPPERAAMGGDRLALRGPEGHVEEGVDLDRQADAQRDLVGMVHVQVGADQLVGLGARLVGPGRRFAGPAGGPGGAPGLGPADQHGVGPSGEHVLGDPVHEGLGRLAAARGVGGAGAGRSHPLGHEAAGVGVAPRQDADDPDRVEAGEQSRHPRVGLGPVGGLGQEVDRFEGLGTVVDPVAELADADEDGGTGVEGHQRQARWRPRVRRIRTSTSWCSVRATSAARRWPRCCWPTPWVAAASRSR